MSDRQDLGALLASRICHDLINPIGAIGNGVELLSLEPQLGRSAEFALVRESVESASARIRFIRVAFGAATHSQYLARSEILGLLNDWLGRGRLAVDWQVEGDFPRVEVRRVFLALLCLETALPAGGVLRVTRVSSGWRISARGARCRIEPEYWRILTDKNAERAPELSPARVQFLLLQSQLASADLWASFTPHDDGLELMLPCMAV